MAIKVVFPAGQDSVSVRGLFQWDYGQVLEIEIPDIGTEMVEVHFACTNMSEAVVRPCEFSNGVGTVTIPDQCLEQTTSITAWIYKIVGSSGHTIKTIILPITARTRPSMVQEIPQEFTDKYSELITEINEAVENLESGNITVAKANNATTANHAATAGNANSASYAASAGNASLATAAQGAPKVPVGENEPPVKTFTFGNQNGFGLQDEDVQGFWEVWARGRKTADGEKHFCALRPSEDYSLEIGYKDRRVRRMWGSVGLCDDGGSATHISNPGLYIVEVQHTTGSKNTTIIMIGESDMSDVVVYSSAIRVGTSLEGTSYGYVKFENGTLTTSSGDLTITRKIELGGFDTL